MKLRQWCSEYMAHHQGMILMAMANFFHKDIMVQRMHSDPRIQSVELLLQEQIPQAVPLQNPYAEDVKGVQRLTAAPVEIIPWRVPVQTPIPQVHLLSNGSYNVLISNMGGGYSSWQRYRPDPLAAGWRAGPVGDLDLYPGIGAASPAQTADRADFGRPVTNPSRATPQICR